MMTKTIETYTIVHSKFFGVVESGIVMVFLAMIPSEAALMGG